PDDRRRAELALLSHLRRPRRRRPEAPGAPPGLGTRRLAGRGRPVVLSGGPGPPLLAPEGRPFVARGASPRAGGHEKGPLSPGGATGGKLLHHRHLSDCRPSGAEDQIGCPLDPRGWRPWLQTAAPPGLRGGFPDRL